MNSIALAHGPRFVEGVKRYRRKFLIETNFFLKYRAWSAHPAALSCTSDLERAVFPRLERGNISGIVDAAYMLGLADSADLSELRKTCTEHAPDLLDAVDGLLWCALEEFAEDPRRREKAIWHLSDGGGSSTH